MKKREKKENTEDKETIEQASITEDDSSKRKEMKKLSRADLLDIIYAMKKNEDVLRSNLKEAREELNKRAIMIEKSGSIAEAALSLSGVFQAAQQAADTYIQSVRSQYESMKTKNDEAQSKRQQIIKEAQAESGKIVEAAQAEGDRIIQEAKQKGDDLIAAAEEDVQAREKAFKQLMKKMIDSATELKTSLKQEEK